MKLKKLLKDIPVQIKGTKEVDVTGICANSKLVAPGNLFIAKKGLTHDGARFIPDAVAAGAVAVLTDIYDPFLGDVVQIIHPDIADIEAELSARYYQFSSNALLLIGITGTNGKTTSTYLIKHLLDHFKYPCGLIGTIEYIVGNHYFPSAYTTPDVIANHKLFQEMVNAGCKAAVMEVSSQAIHQKRVHSIEFDMAIFTNLTQDHLDYHLTMEKYADEKAELFKSLLSPEKAAKKAFAKVAIVNRDCPWHRRMLQDCQAKVITYGIDGPADLLATEIALSADGIRFMVHFQGQKVPFSCSLIGRFNVYNCLGAIAVGLNCGFALEEMARVLRTFKTVPGRLERVPNRLGLNVFVDYAHTDDSLKNVLKALKEIKEDRIITVFGCGGNRDKGKRPKMGAVAEAFSDVAIVTSDNPRNENPETIIEEILSGFQSPQRAIIQVDRKLAIQQAVAMARPSDIVLIAGKGHETYQIFGHQTINFDDRKVAREAMEMEKTC